MATTHVSTPHGTRDGKVVSGGWLKFSVIAGGAAGALTLTGITTKDQLLSVLRVDLDATAANIDLDDLTSEFTITAANTISNASGSTTTGDKLLVVWRDDSA